MQFAEFSSDEEPDEPTVYHSNWEFEYHHKEFSKKYAKSLKEQLDADFKTLRFKDIITFDSITKSGPISFISSVDKKALYTLDRNTGTWTKIDDYFVPKRELVAV